MKNKFKKIMATAIALLLFGGIGYSYAKYSSTIGGNAELTAAAWQIKVNDIDDITDGEATLNGDLAIVLPAENLDVVAGKIAPGVENGYFDVVIDPAGTEVSLAYTIGLGAITPTENIPNGLAITKYSLNGGTQQNIVGTTITGDILLQERAALTTDQKVTVRVYVSWTDDGSHDANHTAAEGTTFTVPVTVTINQNRRPTT